MKNLFVTIMCVLVVCGAVSAKDKKRDSRSAVEQEFGRKATRQSHKPSAPAQSSRKTTNKELKKMEQHLLRTLNPQTIERAPRKQPTHTKALPRVSFAREPIPVKALATSTRAATSSRRRNVTAPYATLRVNRKGYFIGTLFRKNPNTKRADKFTLRDVRGGWAAGKTRGFAKSPVWVQLDRLGKTPLAPYHGPRTPILTGRDSRKLLLDNYAKLINRPAKKKGDGSTATLKRNARLFLNMDFEHGKGLDPHPVMLKPDPNRRIKWRWLTDDQHFLAVRTYRVDDNNKPITPSRWGFIRCKSVDATLGGKALPCH